MNCPDCTSVIPQVDKELIVETEDGRSYEHTCFRCFCKIVVNVVIIQHGDKILIEKYKIWLNEGRK